MIRTVGGGKVSLMDSWMERFLEFRPKDLMIMAACLACFLAAPLASNMIRHLGSGALGARGSGDSSMYEKSLLDTLVDLTFGKLLRRGRGVSDGRGAGGLPPPEADSALALRQSEARDGGGAWPEKRMPRGGTVDAAGKGLAEAVRKAGLPKPADSIAEKLRKMTHTSSAGQSSKEAAAHLSAPSSKGLVKAQRVESNLSRLESTRHVKDIAGESQTGAGAWSRSGGDKMSGKRSGMSAQSAQQAGSGHIEGGFVAPNLKVDPEIQKLHEINAKWQAKLDADEAQIAALEAQAAAAQGTQELGSAMDAMNMAEMKLQADQAAHLMDVARWTRNVQTKLPGKPNGLHDATTKGVMRTGHRAAQQAGKSWHDHPHRYDRAGQNDDHMHRPRSPRSHHHGGKK